MVRSIATERTAIGAAAEPEIRELGDNRRILAVGFALELGDLSLSSSLVVTESTS
jgi:hypothetical protein